MNNHQPTPTPAPANHTIRVPAHDRKRILKLLRNWLTAQANDGCREVAMQLHPSGDRVLIMAVAPPRVMQSTGRQLVRVKVQGERKPAPGPSTSSSSSEATTIRPSSPAKPDDTDYAEPPGGEPPE